MIRPLLLLRLLFLTCLIMLGGCGGGGPDGPVIRPPTSLTWSDLTIPVGLEPDVEYWTALNWRAGAVQIGIAASAGRRRALRYYSLTRASLRHPARRQTGNPSGAKEAYQAMQSIFFALSDSVSLPYRNAETY